MFSARGGRNLDSRTPRAILPRDKRLPLQLLVSRFAPALSSSPTSVSRPVPTNLRQPNAQAVEDANRQGRRRQWPSHTCWGTSRANEVGHRHLLAAARDNPDTSGVTSEHLGSGILYDKPLIRGIGLGSPPLTETMIRGHRSESSPCSATMNHALNSRGPKPRFLVPPMALFSISAFFSTISTTQTPHSLSSSSPSPFYSPSSSSSFSYPSFCSNAKTLR
jgi:hypothetical protein